MKRLTTERLCLRPLTMEDAPAFFALARDPRLGNNAGWKPHETLEESRQMMELFFLGRDQVWALTQRSDGTLIGTIGLVQDDKRENAGARMLGYWLGAAWWGRGLMTEAVRAVLDCGFGRESLEIITANCYPHNVGSRRVLEKAGFVYEGRLRQAERTWDGRLYDHLCYSITRSEWKANR